MDGNYIDKCIEIFEKYLGKGFFDNDTLDVEALYECYIKNYEDIRKEKFINRRSNENLGNFMVTLYKIYPNLLEEIAKYNSDWTYEYLFSFSTLPVEFLNFSKYTSNSSLPYSKKSNTKSSLSIS